MTQEKQAKRSMEFFASKFVGVGHGRVGDCRVVVRSHKNSDRKFVQILDDDGVGLGFELREVPHLIAALSKAYQSANVTAGMTSAHSGGQMEKEDDQARSKAEQDAQEQGAQESTTSSDQGDGATGEKAGEAVEEEKTGAPV